MNEQHDPIDMTLDELRDALAPSIPVQAAFDGWSDAALDAAGAALGLPPGRARLAFPDGPVGMIDAWFASVDRAMIAACPAPVVAAQKIRERIAMLLLARLDTVAPDREALRRALAILALPTNLPAATRLGWRAADAVWRAAGDTATDLNHYTKRTTLAAIYAATLLVFVDDDSEGFADTRAFLHRRIDGIMRFEKLKARLTPDPDRMFSPARFLGRLRYPAR